MTARGRLGCSVQKHKRKNRNVTQVTDQTSVLGDAPPKGEVD